MKLFDARGVDIFDRIVDLALGDDDDSKTILAVMRVAAKKRVARDLEKNLPELAFMYTGGIKYVRFDSVLKLLEKIETEQDEVKR